MLETFGIPNFGIGICLGFRACNFVFEAELCSGRVYPRLEGGDKTRSYGAESCWRGAIYIDVVARLILASRAGTRPTP